MGTEVLKRASLVMQSVTDPTGTWHWGHPFIEMKPGYREVQYLTESIISESGKNMKSLLSTSVLSFFRLDQVSQDLDGVCVEGGMDQDGGVTNFPHGPVPFSKATSTR